MKIEKCYVCKKSFDFDILPYEFIRYQPDTFDNYTCEEHTNPNDRICQVCFAGHTDYPEIKEFDGSGHTKDCSYLSHECEELLSGCCGMEEVEGTGCCGGCRDHASFECPTCEEMEVRSIA